MDRAEKAQAVAALNEVFAKAPVVVVAHYSGLTVAQMQKLRKHARESGASVQVAKNRLAKIALDGTSVASIGPLLRGPTLIAYSDDPVAAPKVAAAFAKDHDKFVILGGALGAHALDPDGVKSLATLRRSTNCARSSWASSRLPRQSSRSSRPLRPESWRASSRPMPTETRTRPDNRRLAQAINQIRRTEDQWPI